MTFGKRVRFPSALFPLVVFLGVSSSTAQVPTAKQRGNALLTASIDERIKILGLPFVTIPPGTFDMGCSPGDNECQVHADKPASGNWVARRNENPSHRVTITKPFDLMVTAVTAKQFREWANAEGRETPLQPNWTADAVPLVNVTWDEAQAFCSFVAGRLPTEAEWEYAARAGTTSARYGTLDDIAWYGDNSGNSRMDTDALPKQSKSLAAYVEAQKVNGNRAHPVGTKAPNGFGLYDMIGNVWQWTADWSSVDYSYYAGSVTLNPKGSDTGTWRVLRGGSWANGAGQARASSRYWLNPTDRVADDGFRCARDTHSSVTVSFP
jgi:formylglycine-generating enzyme required for sulfatase activity